MKKYPKYRVLVVSVIDDAVPGVGDIVCPVQCWPMFGRPWRELTACPITNMSLETRWEGWLGSTNNVDRTAEGAYRVTAIFQHDDARRYVVRLVRVADPA